jgi:hypothetical protein
VVGHHEPATIYFLVDVGDDEVDLEGGAVLQFPFSGLLGHFPPEIAIDVNVLVCHCDGALREEFVQLLPVLLLGIPAHNDRFAPMKARETAIKSALMVAADTVTRRAIP